MYNTTKDMLDAFRATQDTLDGLLRGSSPEQTRSARGGDENWSVVEVICHLRDAEEEAIKRMRLMRDQVNPTLAPYDQEQWAVEHNYAATLLPDALAVFKQLRAVHLAELEALRPDQWERVGEHAEQGQITIGNHTMHLVSHDAIHLAQIARQLADAHVS
jgi:hypothetical protein